MNSPPDVQGMVKSILSDELFQSWSRQHPAQYLTHLFCTLAADFSCKTLWEVGFYDPKIAKMTIFTFADNGSVAIKPADDVFKKEETVIEQLNLKEMKLGFAEAAWLFAKQAAVSFAKEVLGDGFVVLQELDRKTIWNFTFVTKSMKFANMKIDSKNGAVLSNELVEVVQRQ